METRVSVRLTPRASRDQIVGWQDAVLRVRVTAPPAGGRANDALAALLAKALRVPKGGVRIVTGASARDKVVAIDGLPRDEVLARLPTP